MNDHAASSSSGERSATSATPADPRSAPAGQPPRLLRFPDEGPGAGVAAGLGAYFCIDPVFFRIAFLLLTFAGGTGVLLYGIGWLVIPPAPPGQTAARAGAPASDRTAQWVGIGLIVAAAFWLAGPFQGGGPVLWAVALVAIGVILFREDANRRSASSGRMPAGGDRVAAGVGAPPHPSGGVPGEPAARPGDHTQGDTAVEATDRADGEADGDEEHDEVDEEEAILREAARLREGDLEAWSAGGWGGGWNPPDANWVPAPPAPVAPAPRRSIVGRATIGVTLVAVGILALADNLAPGMSVTPARYVALALTIVGGGLLVGAWRGRARGLIPVGLLLLPVLAVTTLFPFGGPWHGGMGERVWRPTAPDEVRSEYSLGAGQLSIDLSDVDFAGDERTISGSVGLGQVEVVVPDDVDVTVTASTGAGELDLFGQTTRGDRLEETVHVTPAGDGQGPVRGDGTLTLDLESGFGKVAVSRAN